MTLSNGHTTPGFQYEYGATGNLEADCDPALISTGDDSALVAVFKVKDGVPNINVVDVEETIESQQTCSDGSQVGGTGIADFKAGTVSYNGSGNGQSISCTDRFTPAGLPRTLATPLEIAELYTWMSDTDRAHFIGSDCPNDIDVQDDSVTCTGYTQLDFTFIDDLGGRHSGSFKFSWQDL